MATLLVPFNESMKLGSGFNSFTQQLCIDNAVVAGETGPKEKEAAAQDMKQVPQSVTYKTSIINRVSDVTKDMKISAAFSVKNDTVNVTGDGTFINSEQIKDSDLSYMFSVKVVNQVIVNHALSKVATVPGLKHGNLDDVYGDSFISGFQEGGEFTAILSIKVKNRTEVDSIVADAKVEFSKEKLGVSVDGHFDKGAKDLLQENETTISVSWNGGGQNLKAPEEDWTFETMRAVALKFPDLVSKTPVRTHAILTKYTALKSFQTLSAQFSPLSYENAGVYTQALQEAYLEYKSIAKYLQLLAFDIAHGKRAIETRGRGATKVDKIEKGSETADVASITPPKPPPSVAVETQPTASAANGVDSQETSEDGFSNVGQPNDAVVLKTPPPPVEPLNISVAYESSLLGVELARKHCRFQMNRIVNEVDLVAKFPQIAQDESRPLPYMSPYLFWQLLPVGKATDGNDIFAQ